MRKGKMSCCNISSEGQCLSGHVSPIIYIYTLSHVSAQTSECSRTAHMLIVVTSSALRGGGRARGVLRDCKQI